MMLSTVDKNEFLRRAIEGLALAVGLYLGGYILFDAFVHLVAPVMKPRTENYSHFEISLLAILIAQGVCSFVTKKPEIILAIFLLISTLSIGGFAWSGPGDELAIVQKIVGFKLMLFIGLPIVCAILCRLQLFRTRTTNA